MAYEFTKVKVSDLPSASTNYGKVYNVTDGVSVSDCTVGGGGFSVIARSNGFHWSALIADKDATAHVHVVDDVAGLNAALGGFLIGSGTTNTVTKWTGASTLGNSSLADTGTLVTALNSGGFLAKDFGGPFSSAETDLVKLYRNSGTGNARVSLFNGDSVELIMEAGDGYIQFINTSIIVNSGDPINQAGKFTGAPLQSTEILRVESSAAASFFEVGATGHIKLEGITSTGATGTGNFVFDASPALTGTPTAPTAAGGTNTTQLATTAFVQAASALAEQQLSTTTVSTNVGTKQSLYAVPASKHAVITKIVVRNPSTSLAAYGADVSFGFDAGAADWTENSTVPHDSVSGLTTSAMALVVLPINFAIPGPNSFTIGAAADVFGCIFNDTSITGTLVVDVFGYLY